MRQLPIPAVTSQYWAFRGGLDQVTPSISINPGRCIASSNVEIGTNGGLTVTQGYERFDGRSKPSDGTYHILEATITGSYALGNTLTGLTSAATGVIVAVVTTGTPYFVITKVTGSFQIAESLQIAAVTIATATSVNSAGSAPTAALDAAYKNLAADEYRDDITAVPGSGSILGVWQFDGDVYAIRNNAGDTAAEMYVATTGGWSLCNLGRELAFTSGGTVEILDGQTITGATSGATAVVGRVVRASGDWSAGTAAGFIYFASQTGTFQAENLNVGASMNVASIAANSTAVTLAKSGRYEFINYNFGGSSATARMYAVSGEHKAFEWNGTSFAFITTGMVDDTPNHLIASKNHLFLSFGASVQHSAVSDPLTWSVVLGAGEIGMGEDVTNFLGAPGGDSGGALVIYTRNKTFVLYGNDVDDWNLITYNPDAGAIQWTAQYIGQGVMLDDRGVVSMSTSQAFGNFNNAVISDAVRTYVNLYKERASAACVVRDKNQYRLFFSGGTALYVTFAGNKVAGLMPVTLSDPVTAICSLEAATGIEEVFFGSSDGVVYQMEKGTSHDGDALSWSATLAYNHFGSPLQLKQFRKLSVEASGAGYCVFSMSYNVGYGTTELPQGVSADVTTTLTAATWDSFVWDQFYWDGQALVPAQTHLDGTAENISLTFAGSSDQYEPITLNGAIVSFTARRLTR